MFEYWSGLKPPGISSASRDGDGVVALGRVVVDRGRRDHDLGAVRAQHRDLLLAHLVRHHEDAAVALARRRDREPDAGVAGGRLDDRAAGLQLPLALGRLDHREPDPVLHRAARIQVLELGEDPCAARWRQLLEPHDRRRADQVEQRWVLARHRREAYATRRRLGLTRCFGPGCRRQQRAHEQVEVLRAERLRDVLVRPGCSAGGDVSVVVLGGEEDHRRGVALDS